MYWRIVFFVCCFALAAIDVYVIDMRGIYLNWNAMETIRSVLCGTVFLFWSHLQIFFLRFLLSTHTKCVKIWCCWISRMFRCRQGTIEWNSILSKHTSRLISISLILENVCLLTLDTYLHGKYLLASELNAFNRKYAHILVMRNSKWSQINYLI